MATISALAVRLTLNAAGFSPAAQHAAGHIVHLGNTAVHAKEHFSGLNHEVEKTEGLFTRLGNAAKQSAGSLLGIVGAGASLGVSLKLAADAETAMFANMQQHIGATQTLTTLFNTLKTTVSGLYAEFGRAFIEASNLKAGVTELTNIASSLKPIAAALGTAFGTVAGWFVAMGKALAPVLIAFKVFAVVVGAAIKVMHALVIIGIARWLAGFVGLRLGALAFQAALLVVKAGYFVATQAAVIFHAMTGPKGWAILAVGAAAAALAVYGVKKAYDSMAADQGGPIGSATEATEELVAATEVAETAAQKMAKAYQEAMKPVEAAFNDVRTELNTLGMTDSQKAVFKLGQQLNIASREMGMGGRLTEEQNEALTILQSRYEELDIRKQMLSVAEELASIEKAAAQEGMTKGQKMLDDLERMGATQQQLADAKVNADRIDSIAQAKQDATDAAKIAADAKHTVDGISPLDKYKKQIEDITRLSKVGALNPRDATRAMNAAGASFMKAVSSGDGFKLESPKALLKGTAEAELAADRAKTPFEKMTDLQQQQLKEARDTARLAREQLAWDKDHGTKVANF